MSDTRERERALDPATSFIVQAPAGSGKTELLIQRFLRLLSCVEQPENILAMTFTRKAAGEMKQRITSALASAEEGVCPAEPHERITFDLATQALNRDHLKKWRLLSNPSRLQILTIDSFCAGLTRQIPLLSGSGGILQIQDSPAELYREAARHILALAETDKSDPIAVNARIVLRHLDNNKTNFLSRIVHMLGKRDQWIIPFFEKEGAVDEKLKEMESFYSKLVQSRLHIAASHFPPQIAKTAIRIAAKAGEFAAEATPDHPLAPLAGMQNLPSAETGQIRLWKAIAEFLLNSKNEWRVKVTLTGFSKSFPGEKKHFDDLIESLAGNEPLREALAEVKILPPPDFSVMEKEVLKATLELLPEMERILRNVFKHRARTDFAEIALAALQSLGEEDNPTDLLLYLDNKIHHILVDEFQDTSYKQMELLKRLSSGWEPGDGKSLFLVGDPMQSIYRFRDAQVGLFLQAKENGIGNIRLEFLELSANFRSQKSIVEWVNAHFERIFPDTDNRFFGMIRYSPSEAVHDNRADAGVYLHPQPDDDPGREALEIRDLVKTLQKKSPEAGVAILVRARHHLLEIVRAFNESGIDYKAEEIDPLTSRAEILDLLALLRAFLSPLDRIAWLSLLRAPWIGLSLEDIHRLCLDDADTPVIALLNQNDRIQSLTVDARNRIDRALPLLNSAWTERLSGDLRDNLENLWVCLGGPACIKSADLQDIELFFDTVSEIIAGDGIASLTGFSRVLETLYARPLFKSANPVQILTMHKAKGLQFDHVIIPGLGRRPKSGENQLVHWMTFDEDLLMAPIAETGGEASPAYDFLKHLDRRMSHWESLRLLYVSATRARRQLHLFGHAPLNKDNDPSPVKDSLLGKLWPSIYLEWSHGLQSRQAPDNPHTPSTQKQRLYRLRSGFEAPDSKPGIIVGEVIEIEETESPAFYWAGPEARRLGSVLHRLLNKISREGAEQWPPKRIDSLEKTIRTALIAEGLSSASAAQLAKKGKTALQNTLADKTGRWILSAHEDAGSELSLTASQKNHFQTRIIDRTFVDENNVRWIVDYKTGEHQGRDLEGFLAEEAGRYKKQMQDYEALMRLSGETRIIKKALYYPLHKRLVEVD